MAAANAPIIALLNSVRTHMTTVAKVAAEGAIGHFEWVDGSLVRALQEGDWVLLDNANFANPTLLDRLNGLLEPNGALLLNECGICDESGARSC